MPVLQTSKPTSVHQPFGDRRQQVDQLLLALALGLVGMMLGLVERGRGEVEQPPHRLGRGLHAHQHAAHVGMVDDGHAVGRLARDVVALHAIDRVGAGVLVGAHRGAQAEHADIDARVVHHREHAREAVVLLADQVADGAAVVAVAHDCGRARVDAELVLERDDADVVGFADRAVVVDQELRHEETARCLWDRRARPAAARARGGSRSRCSPGRRR